MANAYWRPAALDQPKVAYPEYPFPNAAGAKNKPQPLHVARDKAVAKTGPQFSYTNVPWGSWAGPGSYFPGHAAEDQRMAQVNMQGALNQSEAAKAQSRLMARANGGSGGGAGGAGGATGNALYDSFQSAMDRANQANEARYNDMVQGSQSLAERSMGYLDGIGTQQQADTDEAYKKQAAILQQNMINRGLANSTVADTMQMGNERERLADQRRLQADLNQQRLGTDMAVTGNTLGIMERRTDEGPSYELLAQLAMQQGQGGVGSGYYSMPEYASPESLGFNIPGYGGGGYYQFPTGGVAPTGGRSARATSTVEGRRADSLRRADERRRFAGGGGGGDGGLALLNTPANRPINRDVMYPPPAAVASDRAWADWLFGVGG